jgi:hypothetical protein
MIYNTMAKTVKRTNNDRPITIEKTDFTLIIVEQIKSLIASYRVFLLSIISVNRLSCEIGVKQPL